MIHPAKKPMKNGFNLAEFAPSLDGEAGESLAKSLKAQRKGAPAPKESEVQTAIIQAFKLKHRITLWPIDAGGKGFRGSAGAKGHSGIPEGFPDLLGVVPGSGVALFIEVKRPGCKPKPKQTEFLAWLGSMNAIAFWASSVDSALQSYETAILGRVA